jgi:hypothetical protein
VCAIYVYKQSAETEGVYVLLAVSIYYAAAGNEKKPRSVSAAAV